MGQIQSSLYTVSEYHEFPQKTMRKCDSESIKSLRHECILKSEQIWWGDKMQENNGKRKDMGINWNKLHES